MNDESSKRYNVEEKENDQDLLLKETGQIEDFNDIKTKSKIKKKLPFLVFLLIFTAVLFLGTLIFLIIVLLSYKENYKYEEDIYLKPNISEHNYSKITFNTGLEIVFIQIHTDDMAGGAVTFDTGYLDYKYEPGFLRLVLDSLMFNNRDNLRYINEYMGNLHQISEEFYSSTYYTILNSGFKYILENFQYKNFSALIGNIWNITQFINRRQNNYIISNLLNNINEREKHLIEYLVYNVTDENGTDIWRQNIGKNLINKFNNANFTEIEQILLNLFDPKKIKLIFSSHYKMSLMKKYILRYMKDLIRIKPNEIKEENINNYKTLNTNKIIYYQIKENEKNYIKINYYISNNNISLNQLYKDLGYFNYIKYILDETNNESLYYNLTNLKKEGELNIKSLSCDYEIVLKKYIRFSIIINLNYFSYNHIKEIIELVYNYIEKIKSHIRNTKLSDKRAEELFKITEQNFTFAEDVHDGEYYKNKAKDLFYRDEKDYFLKEVWFPKDYNKNFEKIKYYINQLKLENSVVIVGISKNITNKYNLNATNTTNSLIFHDLKNTSNLSNISYSVHNLSDLKLKINNDKKYQFSNYSNKFISKYGKDTNIPKGKISNSSDYEQIGSKNDNDLIEFHWINDTSFRLPKVCINLYFFHPFFRANKTNSKGENEYLFFNMILYISFIQREINSTLSDAIRAGNTIKVGFTENDIFFDIFAYSDLAENILEIIKGIIYSSKEKLINDENNFILSRDYAIENLLNFENVDARKKFIYKYYKFLTEDDSGFPPIYNYYDFQKSKYENSTLTGKFKTSFQFLNFPILRGFILGYYEKEEAQKIYTIFHSNFSSNFKSTLEIAGYDYTKIDPKYFVNASLIRKLKDKTDFVNVTETLNNRFDTYSFMYFADYSYKSSIAVELLIKLFLRRRYRIDSVLQQKIYLSFSFNKRDFKDTSELKERIIDDIKNITNKTQHVDVVGDKYYYIMKNVESEYSNKTYTMKEMAMEYSYYKLYDLKENFPYDISKYDYNSFKDAIVHIFDNNKNFYELSITKKRNI